MKELRRSWRWAALLPVILLGACTVGPDFTRPEAPSVERYDPAPIVLPGAGDGQPLQRLNAAAPPAAEWWNAFESAPLDETVQLALVGSPTLEAASATLAAANEDLNAARGEIGRAHV